MAEVVQELERQKSLGRIRHYGVSNFGRRNLESFLAAGGKPVSNQVAYSMDYADINAANIITTCIIVDK